MAEPTDEPVYLVLEDILELYAAIIDGTPAQAANQLRNQSGLEGALARPASHAYYEEADLAMQASVLAHGIAEGQFFIDGNKRIALIAMLTFLKIKRLASRGKRSPARRMDTQPQRPDDSHRACAEPAQGARLRLANQTSQRPTNPQRFIVAISRCHVIGSRSPEV